MDPCIEEQQPMSEEEEEEEVYDTSASNSTLSMSAFEAVGTSCTGTLTKKQKEKMMKKEKENKGQKKLQIDHISKADYEAKQPQFRRWLMEEKCLVADKLVEAAKKELFKKFVKKWNSRKLANKYYTANTDCWPENAPTPTTLRKWTLPPTPSTPATPAPYPPPRTTYSSSSIPTPSQSNEMELGAGAFSTFGKRAGQRFMKNNEVVGVVSGGAYGTVGRKRDAITEDVAAVWDGAWRAASLQQLPTTERDSSLQDMRTSGVSGSVQSFLPPRTRRNNGPPPPRPPPPPRRTSQRSSESSEQLSGQASEPWGIPEAMGSESGLEVVSLSPEDIYKVSTISHHRSGVWTVSPSIQKASPLSKVIAGSCQSLVNPAFSMSKSLEDVTVGSENALNQTPAGEGSRKMPRFKTPKSFKSLQGCSFIRTPMVTTQNKGEKGIKIASIKAPKISKKAEALKENFVIGNKRSAEEDCGTDVPDSLKGLFTAPASAKKAKLGDLTEERTGIISPIPQEDVVEGYVPEVQTLQNIKEDKKEAKKRQKELKKQEKLEKKQKEKEAKRLRMMEKLKAKEEKKQKEKRRFSTQSLNRFSRMSLREKKSESASSIPAPPPPPSIPPPPPPPSIPPPPPPPPPPPLPGFGKGQGQGQRSQKVGETVIPPAKRPEVPPSPTPVRKHLGHRSVSGSVDENIMQELARKMPPPSDVTSTPLMTRRAPSSRSLSSSSVQGQASLRKIPPTPPLKTRSGGESTEVTGSGVTEQRSRRRQIPSKKMPRDQTRSRSRARARARSRSRSQARGEEISLESMGAVCDTPPPPPLPHNPSKSSLHVPVADFVPPSPSDLPLPPPPSDLPLPPPPSISPSPSLNIPANKPPHNKPAIKSKPLAMKKVAPKKPPRKSLTPKTARARSVTGLKDFDDMNFDDMK